MIVCNKTPSYIRVVAQATIQTGKALESNHRSVYLMRIRLTRAWGNALGRTNPPYPPSAVDSRRPLFNAAFRSSVARSRKA